MKNTIVRVLAFYPSIMGGIQDKIIPKSDIDPQARRIGDKYWLKWDNDQEKLVAYYPLPEVISKITPPRLAEASNCPWGRLKSLKKMTLAEHIKAWVPVVALLIGFILIIVVAGD